MQGSPRPPKSCPRSENVQAVASTDGDEIPEGVVTVMQDLLIEVPLRSAGAVLA